MTRRHDKVAVAERPWTEAQWRNFLHDARQAVAARTVVSSTDVADARRVGLRASAPVDDDEGGTLLVALPAFRVARDFALAVAAMTEQASRRGERRFWLGLASEAVSIAQHIAGGHGLGYEDEHLCGNIVECGEALTHTERCIGLLQSIRGDGGDEGLDALLGSAVFVRLTLQARITALRQRVWWEDRRSAA